MHSEVARLPGCGSKIAELWHQWKSDGHLEEALAADADPMLSVLKLFYDIWGVGDTTAREFYKKGIVFLQNTSLPEFGRT